jgi:hypothetical protein
VNPIRRSTDDYPNHVEPPEPIGDRRLTGAHWWDPDRIRHVEDMPRHCPSCGGAIVDDGGIAIEYWEGDQRVYHTWCHECGWAGDITRVRRMIGHEAEH